MNSSQILVTGGAGFIGSHSTDALIAAGHSVVVLDNLSTGSRDNLNPKAEFIEGDIRDAQFVRRIFETHEITIVNHHAAQLDLRKSVSDPIFDAQTNILGTLTLLEAARNRGGVKQFIFASSGGAVYGEQDYFPADEEHPTRPISPYGVAKRSIELYLHYYQVVHGLNYVSFRYTNVYGPRQNAHGEAGVVAIFIDKLLRGERCMIHGSGEQTRDYVFVGDLVRAHVLAIKNQESSRIYNISTGIESDVNRIFTCLSGMISDGVAEAIHGEAKQGEQLRSVCTSRSIEKELGWKPMVALDEGLRRTVDWFKQQRG